MLAIGVDLQSVGIAARDGFAKTRHHGGALAAIFWQPQYVDAALGRVECGDGAKRGLFIAIIYDQDAVAQLAQCGTQCGQPR
ncbi:MAG: hypothetical protein WDM79_03380 [Terricaulis sp.]